MTSPPTNSQVPTDSRTAPGVASITRNTLWALLAQATTSIFTAATTLVVVRLLGPDRYGVFALAFGLASITGLLAAFGVRHSLARFIAENRSDPAKCALLVRDSLRVVLVTAALSSAALFVAAPFIGSAYGDNALVWPLRGMAVSLFAETILGLYLSTFIALARLVVNVRLVFLESVAEAAATLGLVVVGMGAAGAAFGRAIGYGVGTAIALAAALHVVGRTSSSVRSGGNGGGHTKEILRYAIPLLVLEGLYGLYTRIDVLFIGALLSTTAVGVYSAPSRLLSPLGSVGQAVANSVAPRQTAAGEGPRVDAFTAAVRWLVIFHAALMAPLVAWASPIVRLLLGKDYAESADVLRWLAPAVLLGGVLPLITTTVNFLGRAGQRVPIALGALAVNVCINITLLPRIGVVASAIATSTALFLYVPAHLRVCWKELGFPLSPMLLSALRALTAAAVMAAVLALIGGMNTLSLSGACLGSGLGLVAFTATLMLTREVAFADLRRVEAWLAEFTAWRSRR